MARRWLSLAIGLLAATGCSGGGGPADPDGSVAAIDAGPGDPVDAGPGDPVDQSCSSIYAQGALPDYQIEISDAEWTALDDEFHHKAERIADGLDPTPYHPVVFRFEGATVPAAMIRLKGNSSWDQAIAFDPDPKMQFVISFNETDPDGRFHGVRKLELDMPRSDESFLRQRLALYYLRSIGQPAQCANSARLTINGQYYGLYTNLERLDKEFLQRVFPDAADGDLWEGARILKTNLDSFTWDRLDAFWNAEDLAGLAPLVDLDASIAEWASEAMMPHSDGYYMGRPNFDLYDHPVRGFTWIVHDLDSAFDFLLPDISPVYPACKGVDAIQLKCDGRLPDDRQHYALVMNDPSRLEQYVSALALARAGYDPALLAERVAGWRAQIADAAAQDTMKPFTDLAHDEAVESLAAYPALRAGFVDDWLDCRDGGGGIDADDDGFRYCEECDDADPAVFPGAVEVCNAIDDDCDFVVDEVVGGCPPPG